MSGEEDKRDLQTDVRSLILTKSTFIVMYKILKMFVVAALLTGCSSIDEPENNASPIQSDSGSRITQADALAIADRVLSCVSPTRAANCLSTPSFDYVLNSRKSRGGVNLPDTLAYVINYSNNSGFAIISSDRRVYPVLAYSTEGNFSFENEIAEKNFIENIGACLEEADETQSYDFSDTDFDGCYMVSPMIQISLSQNDPWNKYVVKEHPNCPAGCVAIATALVMSYSTSSLTYHGTTYPMKTILKLIQEGNPLLGEANILGEENLAETRAGFSSDLLYTYGSAVDSLAKIIYWIGKDVNMSYATNGSGAYSADAYALCDSLGLNMATGYEAFDIDDITRYLRNNCIVYLRGIDTGGAGGHAWVSDGCNYCVSSDMLTIIATYIHCDWGWGGLCNGYYSGSVFEASSYNFAPKNYFAIKCE